MQTITFRMEKQWDPAVQHRELCEIACDRTWWKIMWENECMYVWWGHFAVQQKLTKHCLSISSNCFLGPCLWQIDVLRLRVESELQLPACTIATSTRDLSRVWCNHSSRQCRIPNPKSKVRDRTQVLMNTSWVRYHWATRGIPNYNFFKRKKKKRNYEMIFLINRGNE